MKLKTFKHPQKPAKQRDVEEKVKPTKDDQPSQAGPEAKPRYYLGAIAPVTSSGTWRY